MKEVVFGCSKVGIGAVESPHAITGHYTNDDAMTAMYYRTMVESRDPMLAIPQVMACEIYHAEVDC